MSILFTSLPSLADAWKVLRLFLIPIGGGIPGGVLLARDLKIAWPIMIFLYLISDIILAFVFEPIMRFVMYVGRDLNFLVRLSIAFKVMTQKTIAYYGHSTGPLALIMIAFGVDPMTGRAAAVAAGHGFVTGWMIAIAGDMIYFTLLMICTLWLNNIIGDANTTMFIVLLFMLLLPGFIRLMREKLKKVSRS